MHYLILKVKELSNELGRVPRADEFKVLIPRVSVEVLFGTYDRFLQAAGIADKEAEPGPPPRAPKILVLDIETKPLKVWTFGIWNVNIGINQIIEDWSVLAWAAKWIGSDQVFYQDLSKHTDYTKDEGIVRGIWELMNEADVIVTQNGFRFDEPKLNGKFQKYKIGRPKPYKHIDAYRIKRKLGLTSKKLAYTTEYFNERYKKLDHGKFPGFSLWDECLKGNQEAWVEMKDYNIHDVLALEELYMNSLRHWDNTINWGAYSSRPCCPVCGGEEFAPADFFYTKTGAFEQYKCKACGTFCSSKHNEWSTAVRKGFFR